MKRFLVLAAIAICFLTGYAQPKMDKSWKERIINEKIAFFTTEMELTTEEARIYRFTMLHGKGWTRHVVSQCTHTKPFPMH